MWNDRRQHGRYIAHELRDFVACNRVHRQEHPESQEGQDHGEQRIGCLGVRVVTDTVQDDELAAARRQVGDDLLALGSRVGPVGVEAALDDQDRAGDVG